jgi:hypothetical protein
VAGRCPSRYAAQSRAVPRAAAAAAQLSLLDAALYMQKPTNLDRRVAATLEFAQGFEPGLFCVKSSQKKARRSGPHERGMTSLSLRYAR